MTGTIYDQKGREYGLPVLLEWEITHGLGGSCDSFTVTVPYQPEMLPILKTACRFRAVHNGETVFYGVMDGYTVDCGTGGSTVSLEGRSLGALLMDNEAESGEYFNLGLEEVLRRHVTDWGIREIQRASVPNMSHFTVSSGQSQWSVLREYLEFTGNLAPRFDRKGTLLLDGRQGGEKRVIDKSTPVSKLQFRDDRYGVISEVLVKKTRSAVTGTVKNQELMQRGGSARRVIQVPRYTDYDAMRYTGEYQIRKSRENSAVCTLTLPMLFPAFAGDTVELRYSGIGLTGVYRVCESRCWAKASRYGTDLTLAVWEAWN